MSFTAVCVCTDNGYDEGKALVEAGIKLFDEFEVEYIDMGQSYTGVCLKGFENEFNSVHFKFYKDGKPLDIYADPRYNPYYYL